MIITKTGRLKKIC